MAGAARVGFDAHRQRTNPRAGKNRDRAGIGWIFKRDGVARPQKCFADEVNGLLAAVA